MYQYPEPLIKYRVFASNLTKQNRIQPDLKAIRILKKLKRECPKAVSYTHLAQLIPFGCNTPILSIISHDKMQYFLDDIHHPEWGVDVKDEKFGTKLYNKAVDYYSNYQDNIDKIFKEKDYILKDTTKKMNFIKNILK